MELQRRLLGVFRYVSCHERNFAVYSIGLESLLGDAGSFFDSQCQTLIRHLANSGHTFAQEHLVKDYRDKVASKLNFKFSDSTRTYPGNTPELTMSIYYATSGAGTVGDPYLFPEGGISVNEFNLEGCAGIGALCLQGSLTSLQGIVTNDQLRVQGVFNGVLGAEAASFFGVSTNVHGRLFTTVPGPNSSYQDFKIDSPFRLEFSDSEEPVPVPEPTTLALSLLGAVAVARRHLCRARQ
jgi:hypothetical protein